ncbi:MAG: DUF3298 and DUF4163 domain-containing protein [Chitinophagales bacterium]|nr:DUF3298 and DUF4163 domain-containing protein [Chitinophagales bacterium]
MKQPVILLVLASLIFSCGQDKPAISVHKQMIADAGFTEADEISEGEYKRYAGTIAGQPVVLNIVQYENKIQADYYYEKIGIPISLFTSDDAPAAGILEFTESAPGAAEDDKPARWQIKISRDSIVGTWSRADKSYPILLKESYRDDMQRFSIISVRDSIQFVDSLSAPRADFTYQVLLPIGNDEQTEFVRTTILKSMGCDTGNVNGCIKKIKDNYTEQYRSTAEGMEPHLLGEAFNNWDLEISYAVVYNENDIIVLDNSHYEYTGGAHGSFGSFYLNIDRRNKKQLVLNDIMTVDSLQLIALLTKEAKTHFDLEAGQPLSARMFSDELFVPNNFYISNKGITFSYGLYEIASYADGLVELFIPYNKITELLTPEFKQRMRLESVAMQ